MIHEECASVCALVELTEFLKKCRSDFVDIVKKLCTIVLYQI